jgi:alpha-glucosidase
MRSFTQDGRRLDSAYGFDFLYASALTPTLVADAVAAWPAEEGVGWPSWAFENHDAPRAVSRWADPAHAEAFARAKMLLLMCLRGSVFLYYGEELGLTQVEVPFDRLRDPEAIANWPMTLSRDGARTPMPWVATAPQRGFSDAEPWLPVGPGHDSLAIDRQEADPRSLLHLTRRLVALRHAHDALMTGDFAVLHADHALLVFERRAAGTTMLCAFNLSAAPATWSPPRPAEWRVVEAVNDTRDWQFPAYGALVAERTTS